VSQKKRFLGQLDLTKLILEGDLPCHTTCPIIIICMTKNHKCDILVYDAVVTENINNSDICSRRKSFLIRLRNY
jgi:hypothetical protein